MRGELQWSLIVVGILVAIAMELLGISALPVAVGMYLGLSTALPIFVGGMLRWLTDKIRGVSASDAETETSPGVLFSSGYIMPAAPCAACCLASCSWRCRRSPSMWARCWGCRKT